VERTILLEWMVGRLVGRASRPPLRSHNLRGADGGAHNLGGPDGGTDGGAGVSPAIALTQSSWGGQWSGWWDGQSWWSGWWGGRLARPFNPTRAPTVREGPPPPACGRGPGGRVFIPLPHIPGATTRPKCASCSPTTSAHPPANPKAQGSQSLGPPPPARATQPEQPNHARRNGNPHPTPKERTPTPRPSQSKKQLPRSPAPSALLSHLCVQNSAFNPFQTPSFPSTRQSDPGRRTRPRSAPASRSAAS